MKYIYTLLILLLSACAPNVKSNTTSVAKSCTKAVALGEWQENSFGKVVRFNTDCTASLPQCNIKFDYEITDFDGRFGVLLVKNMQHSNISNCTYFNKPGDKVCTIELAVDEVTKTYTQMSMACNDSALGMNLLGPAIR